MSKNPDKTTPATANAGTEQNIAADVDEVMRKYDRESNTRIWSGWRAIVIKVFMACFAVYCICMTLFSTAMPEIRLPLFMGFIILAGFLNFPASKHHVKPNYLPWYDIFLMVIGAACFFYFALNAMTMIRLATRIQPIHVAIGCIGILILVELCRRCVGLPILVVAGLLIVYAFYNQLSYGASFYKALQNIIYKLFYTTSGVIGTPVSVCYTYIVLFIIFGAFLERTGIANFFISFANRLAGWSSGGPAKVAVISSALCGMVSGSSVGNTVTTGSFTIPMMKKTGYKPEFAGAVEAAASTGGQIMPPIMGAAAFLMAEYIGIPYAQVAVKAILPAILYFTGIFISVHLEAKKLGLNGIPRDQLPKWRLLVRDCYLILPLILLVWLVSLRREDDVALRRVFHPRGHCGRPCQLLYAPPARARRRARSAPSARPRSAQPAIPRTPSLILWKQARRAPLPSRSPVRWPVSSQAASPSPVLPPFSSTPLCSWLAMRRLSA